MSALKAPFWTLIVACGVGGVLALADESPKLPDQYAEVVLRVEGMI